jgi:hypothetical protein
MAIDFPNSPALNDTHIVGNITWTWTGSAWAILSTSGGGGGVGTQNTFATIAGDSGSVEASSPTDTLTISGGTDISTTVTGSTVEIAYTGSGGGGGGGGGASSLNELSDVNVSDPQEGEVLKYSAGEWTNGTDATGDGGGGGASNYTELGDAPVGHTVAEFYEHAIATLRVNNVNADSYTFNSHYSGDNPTIYVISGTTIAFDLSDISGHPFLIQDSTGTNITSGLVHISADGTSSFNTNAQGKDSGVLYWRVPETLASPPNYRYQCQSHTAMVGPITIKRLSTL